MIKHSIIASNRAFLKRRGTQRAVANFYVSGTLVYTHGVVNGGGDYSAIIAAIAASYGVNPSAVTLKIEPGSIILNFSVYYGTRPPTIPTNASFIATVTGAILNNNNTTNLTFNGPATSTTLTIATNVSGATSTQVDATNLFNLFQTSGVSLPSTPAFSCVFDNVGNYFLAYRHKIYKVTSGGVVSLFAGGDVSGYVDANGSNARFSFPATGDYGGEMVADSNGNLYVADTLNNRIRKITPNGDVSTLAGSGAGTDADGTGVAAGINGPRGITIDSAGNLFVTSSIITIRQINIITKLVSTITVTSTDPDYKYVSLKCESKTDSLYALGFKSSSDINVVYSIFKNDKLDSQPNAIAVDSSGNFYVTSFYRNKISKVTPSGIQTTFAGSDVPTIAGDYADGSASVARFSNPFGITIDSAGNLYVADSNNHRIRKITSAGVVTTVAGSTSGNANGQGTAAQFNEPYGITIDSAGNLYVADTKNHIIRRIDTSGNVTTFAGSTLGNSDGIGSAAQFNQPRGITIDSTGILYVADSYNNRIRKIDTSGNVTTIAGSTSGYADGQGTAAQFYYPSGITIDSANNLYVADTGNNRIRKITFI